MSFEFNPMNKNCLYHSKGSRCMYEQCPFIPEKVCCGFTTLEFAIRYIAFETEDQELMAAICR